MVIVVSAGGIKVTHRGRARSGSREKEHSAKVAFFLRFLGLILKLTADGNPPPLFFLQYLIEKGLAVCQ